MAVGVIVALAVSLAFLAITAFRSSSFIFEVALRSAQPGNAQFYFDRGGGYSEKDSVSRRISASGSPSIQRFPLPAGEYRSLRFDPIDREAVVAFFSPRIADRGGKTVRAFSRDDFRPAHHIAELVSQGEGWEMRPSPGGDDPYLEILLPRPLVLRLDVGSLALRSAGLFMGVFTLVILLAALFRCAPVGAIEFPARAPLLSGRGHVPALDEIKGVAILLVLYYHTTGMLGLPNVFHGELGVDLFLIVAGLMLACRSATMSAGAFVRRRFFRIFPSYWFAMALFLFLGWYFNHTRYPWPSVILHVFGLHGFAAEDYFFGINDSFWFISMLVAAYGVFLALREKLSDFSLLIGVGGLLTVAACVVYGETGHRAGLSHLGIRIPSFFIGLLAGQILSGRAFTLKFDPPLGLGLISAYYLIFFRSETFGYPVPALGFAAVTVALHHGLKKIPALSWWPALVGWLGVLSYEIFLLHQPLMRDYSRLFLHRVLHLGEISKTQYALGIGGAFVVVLVASWLLHRLAENVVRAPRGTAPDPAQS